eukprot:TRINITY_DN121097_c0_g1_i1.p1 TRINITY_DN121097_c0_g1~~TRINITY_DN121097_c0_g1_i1.p1  ORF type:complete len:332 (-),score=50.04 TRINITY_DN121097_c0_g1_i1:33-974(-)
MGTAPASFCSGIGDVKPSLDDVHALPEAFWPKYSLGDDSASTSQSDGGKKPKAADEVGQLGQSRFGFILHGRARSSGDRVAVKVCKDAAMRKTFANEAFHLDRLRHPNIIQLLDVFEGATMEEHSCMVLGFASGGDLLDYLNKKGHLSETEARQLFVAAIRGIAHCHQNRVAHRDIKADNMLLTEGTPSELKLADFETATIVHKSSFLSENVGTVGYASPQMLMGSYTKACDMWSMGVVLYAMLAGKIPFEDYTEAGIIYRTKHGLGNLDDEPLIKSCSESVKTLIKGLMQFEEARRPSADGALQDPWLAQTA